jgi:murein DD-endopeptidase MepM/ murein hydrolase activator NlpD
VPTTSGLPDLVSQRAAALAGLFSQQPKVMGVAVASRPDQAVAPSGYLNPLRAVTGLVLERIDEGVDFGGSGPVYALGDAVITNAGQNAGWPGGGWITYRLTDGPDAGLMVYLAEDVTPTVQAGQHVTASTVIANMWNGGDGIETGWAQSTGVSAESELPETGGIGGGGPFPTMVGLNFDQLLQLLGVPPAPNAGDPAYGILPVQYPARWN